MDAQPAFFQPGAFFFFLKMPMQWDGGVRRTPQTWLLITTATVMACLEDAREGAQVGDTVPGTSASRVNTDAGHTGEQPDSEVFTPKTRPARTRSEGDSCVGLDSGGRWGLAPAAVLASFCSPLGGSGRTWLRRRPHARQCQFVSLIRREPLGEKALCFESYPRVN